MITIDNYFHKSDKILETSALEVWTFEYIWIQLVPPGGRMMPGGDVQYHDQCLHYGEMLAAGDSW